MINFSPLKKGRARKNINFSYNKKYKIYCFVNQNSVAI